MPAVISSNFLEDLAFVLVVAAAISVIFQALRQPVVVGYLVAGMLVGPHLPFPLFADMGRIHTLSELGVILLMFALGLEFSLRKLVQLAPTAGFITVVQMGLVMWLGYEVGRAFGWTELEGIFTGAILAISSTTIIAKAFAEEKVDKGLGELVFGITLFEDLGAVVVLAVLTAVATGAGLSTKMIAITVGQLVAFLAVLIVVGMLIVPRTIRLVARFEREETLVVASIGICFAVAMIAEMAGYSVALGAFLAGVLVAESGHGPRIEHLVAPLRDIFGAIFFVSVGMMLDPRVLVAHWPELLGLVAVVLVGKIAGVSIGAILSGSSTRTAVQASMSMAQIGEFSFIIVSTGLDHGATREFLYVLTIAVSVVTTFMTPFMIRGSDRASRFIDAHVPRSVGVLQAIYDSWAEQARALPQLRDYRGAIVSIGFPMAAVMAVAIAYSLFVDRFQVIVAIATGASPGAAILFVKATALLLAAVPCVSIWRGVHRLAGKIASSISSPSAAPDEAAMAGRKSDPLAGIFEIAIIFAVVTLILAIIGPFINLLDGLAVMAIALAGLAIVIWRNSRDLYARLRESSAVLVERMASVPGIPPRPISAGSAVTGGGEIGPLTQVRIQEVSNAVGRSLGEINLHAATGAMVMAVEREGRIVILPGGSEVLRAGDMIALAGPSNAVTAASEILTAPVPATPGEQPVATSE